MLEAFLIAVIIFDFFWIWNHKLKSDVITILKTTCDKLITTRELFYCEIYHDAIKLSHFLFENIAWVKWVVSCKSLLARLNYCLIRFLSCFFLIFIPFSETNEVSQIQLIKISQIRKLGENILMINLQSWATSSNHNKRPKTWCFRLIWASTKR